MPKTKLISFTESFHQAWKIWIEHFLKFTSFTTIIIFATYLFATTTVAALNRQFGLPYFVILSVSAIIFVQFWGVIALYLLTLKHGELSFHDAVMEVKKYFWDFVFLTILEIILSFFAGLVGYFFVVIVGAIVGLAGGLNVLNDYFNWLLIFPAFTSMVLANYLVFAAFCLLDKNLTPWRAIKESYNLMQGNFWHILWRLILAFALVAIVGLGLSFVPRVGYALSGLLMLPFLIIYTYTLYTNLRNNAA